MNLPDSLTEIGRFAFSICEGITSFPAIPANVTEIPDYMLQLASSLTYIPALHAGIERIGEQAFYGMSSVDTGIMFYSPELYSIGANAFSYSGFVSIEITFNTSVSHYLTLGIYEPFGNRDCSPDPYIIHSEDSLIGVDATIFCVPTVEVTNDDSRFYDDDPASDDSCINVDSEVTYKGNKFSYTELLNGAVSECVVPHTVTQRGLSVTTSCGHTIRLSRGHLLLTTEGYVTAESLVAGEHGILSGLDGTEICKVTNVVQEKADQQYFGLNCLHSEVAANNLHVSTFGNYHAVPAWYMYLAGNLLGIQMASRIGDAIAHHLYFRFF